MKRKFDCKVPACTGILVRSDERIVCLLCSRKHDENGELIIPTIGNKYRNTESYADQHPGISDISSPKVGRPRNKTSSEIKQSRTSVCIQKNKGGHKLPDGLAGLKRMYREKIQAGELLP